MKLYNTFQYLVSSRAGATAMLLSASFLSSVAIVSGDDKGTAAKPAEVAAATSEPAADQPAPGAPETAGKTEGDAKPDGVASQTAKDVKEAAGSAVDMLKERTKRLMAKLAGRSREVDPFGMSMNAENEVVHEEEAEQDAPRQVTTLEEAVSRFRVTGVVPRRQEVIVGARSLGLGDRVIIEHREVRFLLTIVEITAQKISLKDEETDEIASVALGIVPDQLPSEVAGRGAPAAGLGIQPMGSAYQVESE